MEFNDIMSAVSALGFPIVMCFFIMKTTNEQLKANTLAISELQIAITRLVSKLDADD